MPISPRTRQSTPRPRTAPPPGRRRRAAPPRPARRVRAGPREHVGRALGHLGVAHAVRGRPAQAHVGDQQHVVAAAREHAGGGLAAGGRGRDLGRDVGVEQARAVGDVAVVGGAHEHAGADAGGRRRARDRGPALDQRLERAEAAGGLDQRVEAVARGRGGGAVGAGVGRRASGVGPAAQRSSMTTSSSGGALGPARRLEPGPHRPLVGPAQAQVGDRVDARGDAEAARAGRRAGRSSPSRRRAPRRGRPATGSRSRTRCCRRRSRGSSRGRAPPRRGRRGRSRRRCRAAPRPRPRSSGRGTGSPGGRSGRPGAGARAGRSGARRCGSLPRATTMNRQGCMRPTDGALVGGGEHPPEHPLGHRVGAEAADVAALGEHAVDGGAGVVVVAPAARVGGALGGARGVEARRGRRPREAVGSAHRANTRRGGSIPRSTRRREEPGANPGRSRHCDRRATRRESGTRPPHTPTTGTLDPEEVSRRAEGPQDRMKRLAARAARAHGVHPRGGLPTRRRGPGRRRPRRRGRARAAARGRAAAARPGAAWRRPRPRAWTRRSSPRWPSATSAPGRGGRWPTWSRPRREPG